MQSWQYHKHFCCILKRLIDKSKSNLKPSNFPEGDSVKKEIWKELTCCSQCDWHLTVAQWLQHGKLDQTTGDICFL